MKFGGTSVGSVESILNVKKIVEASSDSVVVVVSALGGVTDQLIRTAQMAQEGDAAYLDSYHEMVGRHHRMIDAVIPDVEKQIELLKVIDAMLDELKSIYQGVYLIHDLSEKTLAFRDIAMTKNVLKDRLRNIYHTRIVYPTLQNEEEKKRKRKNEALQ
jgi:aspartokinase/homoserine dehydrogenase 1